MCKIKIFFTVVAFIFSMSAVQAQTRTGPGGVSTNLLLWLRADDPTSITTVNYPSSNAGLNGYPAAYIKNPAAIPTVDTWKDPTRDGTNGPGSHTWTYAAGGNASGRRRPVFEASVREMNYHPSVRFWGNGTSTSAFLANPSASGRGITTSNPSTHTALFVLNNNFGAGPRAYEMVFTANVTGTPTDGPAYGIEKDTDPLWGYGRYRTDGGSSSGPRPLMELNSTTVADFFIDNAARRPLFRFNGLEDSKSDLFPSGSQGDLSRGSILGMAVDYNRTIQGVMSEIVIYNGLLNSNPSDLNKVESYLAIKYGVTLRPSPDAGNAPYPSSRYDYKFSSGGNVWQGQTGSTQYQTYYNRVAAVIRDDNADLDNGQAISTIAGSLLHLGVAGVPGTVLDADGNSVTGDLNNLEAVAFGDDNATGFSTVPQAYCGDFDSRFSRTWLIHKVLQDTRPISMIVGIQNNADFTIGQDAGTAAYYGRLNGTYALTMIIADSPANIQSGVYKAIIPMTYINGVWQCNYAFSKEDTYITFGTKTIQSYIPQPGDFFSGIKTFYWNNWTSATNSANARTVTVIPTAQYGNLGDNVIVTRTSAVYPAAVLPTSGYPRSVNTPESGSLEVRRRGAAIDAASEIRVGVKFNRPIIPNFYISDIDGVSDALEQVEIVGYYGNFAAAPTLTYAVSNGSAYRISGNIASAINDRDISSTDARGKVFVTFNTGIDSVLVKYRIAYDRTTARQSIYISPITIRSVPLPPPVNEDGLSFVKYTNQDNIETCESLTYYFEIGNNNCESKTVSFSDTLPPHMKWVADSYGLDGVSADLNPDIHPVINTAGNVLTIENLTVSSVSTLLLMAKAVFDDSSPSGEYANYGYLKYSQLVENVPYDRILHSSDKYTLDSLTIVNATYSDPYDPITLDGAYSKATYMQDDILTISYTVTNPNATNITDMYLDIGFNDEFTYVANSLSVAWLEGTGTDPAVVSSATGLLLIGASGNTGFTMPKGKLQLSFKLKAPAEADLAMASNGVDISDLNIAYNLYSNMIDPCLPNAMSDTDGIHTVPYSKVKQRQYIIVNEHLTPTLKK